MDWKAIDIFEMWAGQRLCEVKWMDHISNENIHLCIRRQENLSSKIIKQQLCYFGHIANKPQDSSENEVQFCIVEGKSVRGQPKTQWIDNVKTLQRPCISTY